MDRKQFLAKIGALGGSMMLAPQLIHNESGGKPTLTPFLTERELSNSHWYLGHFLSLLIGSEQTGGKYALLRVTERRGLEPPPHTHTREDETFLVLDGEIDYTVGDKTFSAKSGSVMFLPRNIQHSFKIQTETAETMMLLTPGGFENYFLEMSEEAKSLELPPMPEGSPDVQKLVATASKYGIIFPKKP